VSYLCRQDECPDGQTTPGNQNQTLFVWKIRT
jgi:hypothetical protein